jgi:hypothetical protein
VPLVVQLVSDPPLLDHQKLLEVSQFAEPSDVPPLALSGSQVKVAAGACAVRMSEDRTHNSMAGTERCMRISLQEQANADYYCPNGRTAGNMH